MQSKALITSCASLPLQTARLALWKQDLAASKWSDLGENTDMNNESGACLTWTPRAFISARKRSQIHLHLHHIQSDLALAWVHKGFFKLLLIIFQEIRLSSDAEPV